MSASFKPTTDCSENFAHWSLAVERSANGMRDMCRLMGPQDLKETSTWTYVVILKSATVITEDGLHSASKCLTAEGIR